MKLFDVIKRSLFHFRRQNLAVILGVAVSTAVITGALLVGGSVKQSLRSIGEYRLGKTQYVLPGGDRFFRTALENELGVENHTALLTLKGLAVARGGRVRVPDVFIYGAPESFYGFSPEPVTYPLPGPGECIINGKLAAKLGLTEGSNILLRFEKPDMLSRDVPLTSDEDTAVALRLKIMGVAQPEELGRFSLRAEHITPYNVFVDREFLAAKTEFEGKANILISSVQKGGEISLDDQLTQAWRLADSGIYIRSLEKRNVLEVRSERIFIEDHVLEAVMSSGKKSTGVFSYFVNGFRKGDKETPYSFIAAPGNNLIPSDMQDDEIIINEWLAEDLGASAGDTITVDYYVPGVRRNLIEKSREFNVRAVVPLKGAAADRDLVLDVPGLADAESCSDWDPGIPVDLDRIRDKDEKYWDDHRGTPKAFITLKVARELWANRFGSMTAVRFPAEGNDAGKIAESINSKLSPSSFGLSMIPVRQQAERASSGAVDFTGLFLALSFFVIIGSLVLTGLLFSFGIESRSDEIELLRAVGFTVKKISRMFLAEGLLLSAAGSLVGVLLGAVYNALVIILLSSVWKGAVASISLKPHFDPIALLVGFVSGIIVTVLVIFMILRKLRKRMPGQESPALKKKKLKKRTGFLKPALLFIIAAVIVGVTGADRSPAGAAAYFFSGVAVLTGFVLLWGTLFRGVKGIALTRREFAFRNNLRKSGRSIAVILLLSCGIFIVMTAASNRLDPFPDGEIRSSGTGGFALYGETSLPILQDLNTVDGRETAGLDEKLVKDSSFVHIRVKEGDLANCLNLNKVAAPQIIGVDPEEFAKRGSFTVTKTIPMSSDVQSEWEYLEAPLPDGSIPAYVDASVLMWALQMKLGDTIEYLDENGNLIRIVIAGTITDSIFQGNLIIDEDLFIRHFPSSEGSNMFLVDVPVDKAKPLQAHLEDVFSDLGPDVTLAAARLAEFNEVQNTYLTVFLMLGGLGILIGSAGIAVVIMRNILDRRGELGLLQAVGFSQKSIKSMLLTEHTVLLAGGVIAGTAAGIFSSLPSILSPGQTIPLLSIFVMVLLVLINGFFWVWLGTRIALTGDLLESIRNE